jgi:DNA polymerase III gamma/tau subunit
MPVELYRKYRPKKLADVVGQDSAVKIIEAKLSKKEWPHAVMFQGPSGCGKTTLARIIKTRLKCREHDFRELNCADIRGIEAIRNIREEMPLSPLGGKCRIYLIDEAHKLTNDAQNAMLKMLEDTPDHVYFMLATSEPGKLIKAIQTRCLPIAVKAVGLKTLCELIASVIQKAFAPEEFPPDDVIEKIAELADGSPRTALVLLDKIRHAENATESMEILEKSDVNKFVIDLCRTLINPSKTWKDTQEVLKAMEEEPETIRRRVLLYVNSILLGPNTRMHGIAYLIIQCFRDHVFDCGKAGISAACWEVKQSGKQKG